MKVLPFSRKIDNGFEIYFLATFINVYAVFVNQHPGESYRFAGAERIPLWKPSLAKSVTEKESLENETSLSF